jgi:glycosyltransferase involved in cell wall biosynthesis
MRIFVNEFCGHPFQMELSRNLARRGHTVYHVYFADNMSTPKGRTQRRADDPESLTIEGLHITRKFSKHSILTRRQADIEYGQVAAAAAKKFRPDVIISANMPLDAQAILQNTAHRLNVRFVFWLQDVYSAAAKFVLRKKSRLLAWVGGLYFERLEKKLLRRSDAIVCIAPGFAEFIQQWGISSANVHVIENWAPLDEVRPQPKANAWAREHGVDQKFCFMYSGTLGMKHRPEILLALAKFLESRGGAALVVIAGGAGFDWLRERAHEVSPGALILLPFQPYERLSEVMAAADTLITLLDSEAGTFSVPSKTLAYLCAGRSLIVGSPRANEVARVVERANAGIAVSPDDPAEIIEAAERLLADPSLCARFGASARAYAEKAFAIDAIAARFLSIFGCPVDDTELVAASVSDPAISQPSHAVHSTLK